MLKPFDPMEAETIEGVIVQHMTNVIADSYLNRIIFENKL